MKVWRSLALNFLFTATTMFLLVAGFMYFKAEASPSCRYVASQSDSSHGVDWEYTGIGDNDRLRFLLFIDHTRPTENPDIRFEFPAGKVLVAGKEIPSSAGTTVLMSNDATGHFSCRNLDSKMFEKFLVKGSLDLDAVGEVCLALPR